jgi:hypothetical protein
VTGVDSALGEYDRRFPQLLPGGRAALFDRIRTDFTHEVAAVDLTTGRVTTLVEDAGFPRHASSGHLLFGRQGRSTRRPSTRIVSP